MKYKKLYTAADGYGCNHIYPMWSELLARVLNIEWVNLSVMGAGNEILATQVIEALEKESNPEETLWVVQWTSCKRLDLQIDLGNQELLDRIKTDSIYSKNFITTKKNRTFWVSSASKQEWVTKHNDLILEEQHVSRSRMYQLAATYALEQRGANYEYMFAYDPYWSKNNLIDNSKYIWDFMYNFKQRSKYADLDVGEIQPVSSVQLDFLKQYLLPKLEYDHTRYEQIFEEVLIADRVRRATRN
jgi:hypothetical protein